MLEPMAIQADLKDYDHVTQIQAEELRTSGLKIAVLQRMVQERDQQIALLTKKLKEIEDAAVDNES